MQIVVLGSGSLWVSSFSVPAAAIGHLNYSGFCVEGLLIDASTQDTSPFCLLLLSAG